MNHLLKLLALASLVFAGGSQGVAQTHPGTAGGLGVVLSEVPRKVDKKARYLIYLSGFIVEAGNTRPTSPKYGVYEYEKILEALRQGGFVVISEAREQTHDIEAYARKVAGRVRLLLDAGVPPQNITVVGASQGGWIGMLASTYLKNRSLNFVVIGACGADDPFLRLLDLHGNVLFIAEQTDRFPIAKCQRYRDDATGLGASELLVTNTGQAHGFLYRPLREWVEPTIAWARRPDGGLHPTPR
jgi:pimeloyl-ACP methyl ester carboxylesterase